MRSTPLTAVAIRVAIGVMLLVFAGAGLRGGRAPVVRTGEEATPRLMPASPVAGASEATFRAGFSSHLDRAAGDARVLMAMGETRDRNLVRVRTRQDAMLGRLAAADAWLDANPIPSRFSPAVTAYRDGAASIRAAMEEAQAGFLRFDFERVARATETLERGDAALNRAIALLGGTGSATAIP